MRSCIGIPHGVRFALEKFTKDIYKLRAKGYGDRTKYGNGVIYTSFSSSFIRRVE
jgi:hypothetical protein